MTYGFVRRHIIVFDNFHIAAITKRNEMKLRLIEPRGQLQDALIRNWWHQFQEFLAQEDEKDFTIGYTPEEGEHFRICPYDLPEWLEGKNSENARNIEQIHRSEYLVNSITGIVAFTRDGRDNELMLFQNFNKGYIIQPGGYVFFGPDAFSDPDLYKSAESRLLRLDNKLSAVYLPEERELLFDSFRNVNTFLPISDSYYIASEKDIRNLLNHRLFECNDKKTIIDNATQFMRRRFAILKDSEILDTLCAAKVKEQADKHNINIQINDDKIIFPTENDQARTLLQFLNEEIFQGSLTNEIYETNSKKKINV